jgi:hypothetical protein
VEWAPTAWWPLARATTPTRVDSVGDGVVEMEGEGIDYVGSWLPGTR